MKIAICLFGNVGGKIGSLQMGGSLNPKFSVTNYMSRIVQEHEVDFFVHSWSEEYKELINRLCEPKAALFEKQIDFTNFEKEKYSYDHYQKNIEDFPDNNTRFLVIGNIDIGQTKKDKTSFLIQTDNRPGALIKILEPFNKRKINLERIETRPSRESKNAHNFFIDSSGHYKDLKLKQVIVSLKELGASVRILGSYPSDS